MHFPARQSLVVRLLVHLQKRPWVIVALVKTLQKESPGLTKQGVYAALRVLKKEEIIVVHGKQVSLNNIWLKKMSEFFAIAEHYYSKQNTTRDSFLQLDDGDKIKYLFKDPKAIDAFWGHAIALLIETMEPRTPVYLYNPHEWFLLVRREAEVNLMRQVTKHSNQWLLVNACKDPLDKYVSSEFDGTMAQYYLAGKRLFQETYYLNIFNDFLIEVWLDPATSKAIDSFYKKQKKHTLEAAQELAAIIAMRGRNKMTISRNAKKAARLKRMLSKYFWIKNK